MATRRRKHPTIPQIGTAIERQTARCCAEIAQKYDDPQLHPAVRSAARSIAADITAEFLVSEKQLNLAKSYPAESRRFQPQDGK
jgi:hypothetical protein